MENYCIGDYINNIYFCRKPYNLEEVKKGEFRSNNPCKTRIDKIIKLNNEEFELFCSDFYVKRTELELIGGYDRIEDYTHVILVENKETNQRIYINTEGFDYARYVGIKSLPRPGE